MEMQKDAKIYVAGHRGLVGAAIVRRLATGGYRNLLLRTREEVDLTDRAAVAALFESERPAYVFDAAAKVGGIHANDEYPADFIRDNILIQMNVIDAAYRARVRKLAFLGSSCIYPKLAPQPLKEEYLLTGPLEPTSEWYAIAKISGIKACQAYRKQHGFNAINLMPSNLYGPGDNFNLQTSHVLPALIRKFQEAKDSGSPFVVVWGSGAPRREFLYVDDLADACVHLMEHYNDGAIINIGTGQDISIADLAKLVKDVVQYDGDIRFDRSRPDGTPRKLLDVTRLSKTGWRYRTDLRTGIERTYEWFLDHQSGFRG
jgi:GDP-L-fucose synthase